MRYLILILAFFIVSVGVSAELDGLPEVNVNEGQIIFSPLEIEFNNRGLEGWYGFEGQLGVVRLMSEDDVMAVGILAAGEDWMTTDPVTALATLVFDVDESYPNPRLVFENENASDIRELDRKFEIPVKFLFEKESNLRPTHPPIGLKKPTSPPPSRAEIERMGKPVEEKDGFWLSIWNWIKSIF